MRVRLWCLLAVVASLSAATFAQEQQPPKEEQQPQPTTEQAQQPQPAQEPAPAPKPAEEAAQPQAQPQPAAEPQPPQAAKDAAPASPSATAKPPALPSLNISAQEMERAIKTGMAAKGRARGLTLLDSGRGFMNALASMDGQGGGGGTGFSLRVFTPLAWMEQEASDAAKEYRTLTAADFDEDFQQPVLRVLVNPDTPTEVTKGGMRQTSSVQHVVLRDAAKKIVIQPLYKDTFTEDAANAVGARFTYEGVRATFALDDVVKVRGPAGTGEFLITVVGVKSEKDFKVKFKHFDELPGPASAAKK